MLTIEIIKIEVDNEYWKGRGCKIRHRAIGTQWLTQSHKMDGQFTIELDSAESAQLEELLGKIMSRYRQALRNEL